jgi:hypothetical protein
VLALASVAWFASTVAPVAADEMILNNWTARRGSAKATLRSAAPTGGDTAESPSTVESQRAATAAVSSQAPAPAAGEARLHWHARRPADGGEMAEPAIGARVIGAPLAGDPVVEEAPDGFPIRLTAVLEPIPAQPMDALEPIPASRLAPASRMPRLAPAQRRGDPVVSDRKKRDHTRSQVMTIAAEGDEPLKDPFADEEMQPSRSRLKKPAAESIPTEPQPQPLQNESSNEPAMPATPKGNDELLPPMKLPSPSDLPRPSDEPPPLPESLQTAEPSSPCDVDKKECGLALDRLKANSIDKIALSIRINGSEGADFPCECTLGNDQFIWRHWSATTHTFKAAGTCHKPLYFEDVQLERYGHTWNPALQGILSGAHFFANLALLPYHMGINPPNECIYTLGYYRPGLCAPYVIEPFPLSVKGAAFQIGGIASGLWILNLY